LKWVLLGCVDTLLMLFTFALHTLIKRYIELLYGDWKPRHYVPLLPSSLYVVALGVECRVDIGEGDKSFFLRSSNRHNHESSSKNWSIDIITCLGLGICDVMSGQ
jgi:hypothetical protein